MSHPYPIWHESRCSRGRCAALRPFNDAHIEQPRSAGPHFVVHTVCGSIRTRCVALAPRWIGGAKPGEQHALGSGVADALGMIEAHQSRIGTDAATCTATSTCISRCHRGGGIPCRCDTSRWLSAPQVFAAHCRCDARRVDRIGRIAPGYAADIVFWIWMRRR